MLSSTFKKGQEGVHNYTVEEVAGTDATVTYDTMKATVTITVSHKGTAKALVATLGDIADKEFNNVVTPPTEPSSNQRNTLFLKKNTISLVTSSLMTILN
ncbi:MAG: Spy0128 family protein [Streptococcus sp.]